MAVPFSREILNLFVGKSFAAAWLPLSIMFIVPVYQSLAQINSSFFFASGKTKTYRNIVIATSLMSLPVTYFVLAPADGLPGGLGLGATGLAIKMLIIVGMTYYIQSYLIARHYHWRFYFWHQLAGLVLLLAWSFVIKYLCTLMVNSAGFHNPLLFILPSTVLGYLFGAMALLYCLPWLAGTTRDEIVNAAIKTGSLFKLSISYIRIK